MKRFQSSILILCLAVSITGCATVFDGKVTRYQKTKLGPGEQQREIRVGALIADIILFWPGAIVDFATDAIYKPEGK